MNIERFSFGIGDRFGREGVAQLAALQRLQSAGTTVAPVWNKSYREHSLIGTTPAQTAEAARAAVKAAGWTGPWHLDADHIGLKTVAPFIEVCDFFTLDVADFIGEAPTPEDAAAVEQALAPFLGRAFPELGAPEPLDRPTLDRFLACYAGAIQAAVRLSLHISAARPADSFITEVSTDEAETPQSPLELFLILGALAAGGVAVQTIAPKFSGRFNKGVDYVGQVDNFTREFDADLRALALARDSFDLPATLKLSVHSGSDKFSLYGPIRNLLREHNAGLHLKTAGTTWLEEVTGLALAGGEPLAVAQAIYATAYGRREELSKPYATVIDIDPARLPTPETVAHWSGPEFAAALQHEQAEPRFNPHLRQLLHVSFKVAAEMGARFTEALEAARPQIAACVTDNLYRRHVLPLFG